MNACKECIAYKIHLNEVEPGICMECGKRSMVWKQNDGGSLYLECQECSVSVAVDLNTPCELDPLFQKQCKVIIEPQTKLPDKKTIMMLAKHFQMNTLQMREKLIDGYSVEMGMVLTCRTIRLLDENKITYRLEDWSDPEEKYLYYKECRYPYSTMRVFFDGTKKDN